MSPPTEQDALRAALKRTAVALKESGVPYALGGSYAAWARGAAEPVHDVDFVIAQDDAGRLEEYLAGRGLQVERPPEDWLLKVHTDDCVVDLLFRLNGEPVQRDLLTGVEVVDVLSVQMPVLPATDLLVQKLRALDEHHCDLATVLPLARALREQVDWPQVRERLRGNDFGEVCLHLVVRLGIVAEGDLAEADLGRRTT